MITFRRDLYVGDSALKDKKRIVSDIRHHVYSFGVYVIVPAANCRDIFDIIPTFMLSDRGYKGRDLKILGLAQGKREAMELCARMVGDVYEKTGGLDIRAFFSKEER